LVVADGGWSPAVAKVVANSRRLAIPQVNSRKFLRGQLDF
jgi:hypothetical protein